MQTVDALSDRVLLFGGPYSNLQATIAMQLQAMRLGVRPQNTICNGDLIAYCADPEATVDLIRQWGIQVLMGNCEQSIGNQRLDCGCGFAPGTLCSTLSVEWYHYANARVSAANRMWMRSLPERITFSLNQTRFAVIHGGLQDISEFVFESGDATRKSRDIASLDVDCIVGGHCGLPFGNKIGQQYWLNTGVIGMPANDGTPDGWYLLLTPDQQNNHLVLAEWHRLEFDTDKAVKAMRQAKLSGDYQQALRSGLWPCMQILPAHEKNACGKALSPAPLLIG